MTASKWVKDLILISKWIKDLNIRRDNIKLIEENIDRPLFDIYSSNIFLNLPPTENKKKQLGPNQM